MSRADVELIVRSKVYRATAGWWPFYTHFTVWVNLIVEEPTMTVKCRTAMMRCSFT